MQLDGDLLCRIANAAFIESAYREQTVTYFANIYLYSINWSSLTALASTCKLLRNHLQGIQQLYLGLNPFSELKLTALDLAKWKLSIEKLRHSATKLTLPPFGRAMQKLLDTPDRAAPTPS